MAVAIVNEFYDHIGTGKKVSSLLFFIVHAEHHSKILRVEKNPAPQIALGAKKCIITLYMLE